MTDCQRLRVAFAGTPEFAAVSLQALIASEHEVVGVLTQPDRPSGRGRKLTPSAVKQLAVQHNIPVLQPLSLRDERALADLSALKFDVMVVVAYGLILPSAVLELSAYGCLNVHASLLPRWRGAAPIQRALLAGDEQSGVCIMQMDDGLDTGDVLHREAVPLANTVTGGELHDTLALLGAEALLKTLPRFCAGSVTPEVQSSDNVTYAKKLDKSEARLDFSRAAIQLQRQIQAFNPWPVAETNLDGNRLRVWRSSLVVGTAVNSAPQQCGSIVAVTEQAVRVVTGDGLIDLLELQLPGGRSMPAVDFSRGRELPGKVLG